MTDKIRFFLWLVALAIIIYIIHKVPTNLGLDLQGGMRLVVEAQDTKEYKVDDNAIQGVISVIRNRVDGLGVSEPLIAIKGKRQVVIELPGIKDSEHAIKLIGETAMMEFVEAEWLPGNAATISTEDLKVIGGENAKIAMYDVRDPQGNLIKSTPIILKRTALSGHDLKWAGPSVDQYGKPVVSIEFSAEGAGKFAEITRLNVGKPLAIILDGRIISAPNISEQISGGKAQISGSFTPEDVQDMVIKLKAGSLPVPVKIVEKKEVGPTLGKDSINKSLKAGVIGYILVSIFMMVFYRYLGFISIIALMFYLLLNIAVFNLFKVTLTLPGIAGIILGLGMAVDANILIFERYKDELKNGNTIMNALETGFKKARITIIDSNLTTLITAVVLFWFGTGSIKGFAVTLTIGILISMITALYLSHFLLASTFNIRRIRESNLIKF